MPEPFDIFKSEASTEQYERESEALSKMATDLAEAIFEREGRIVRDGIAIIARIPFSPGDTVAPPMVASSSAMTHPAKAAFMLAQLQLFVESQIRGLSESWEYPDFPELVTKVRGALAREELKPNTTTRTIFRDQDPNAKP